MHPFVFDHGPWNRKSKLTRLVEPATAKTQRMSTDALINTLRCPITGNIMVDPAILVCTGLSYERTALENWIVVHGTDPASGEKLQDARIVSNPCFRSLIEAIVGSMGI